MTSRFRWLPTLLLGSMAVALAAAPATAADGYFAVDGVRLHYEDAGQGEPVVLIHGLSGSAEVEWDRMGIVNALRSGYRVLAIDVRGHGKSDKPHDQSRYGTQMSEDILRLLDNLNIRKAHIVGYSMGSIIAGKFVATHPDRVIDVVFGGLAPDPNLFAPTPGTPPPNLPVPTPAELQELQSRNDGEAIGALVPSLAKLALTPRDVASLHVPMLAIVGSNDPLKPTVDAFAKLAPSMRVVVIEGATHSGANSAQANPLFVRTLQEFFMPPG